MLRSRSTRVITVSGCLVLSLITALWFCQRCLRQSRGLAEADKLRWITCCAIDYINGQMANGVFRNAALSNISSLSQIPLRQDIPVTIREIQGSSLTDSISGTEYGYSPVTPSGEVLFLKKPDILGAKYTYHRSSTFWMWSSCDAKGLRFFVFTDGVVRRLYDSQVDWRQQTVLKWPSTNDTQSWTRCQP
jgi:hypothetical protein